MDTSQPVIELGPLAMRLQNQCIRNGLNSIQLDRVLIHALARRIELEVRFAPKTTRLLRSSEMTRCANNGNGQPLVLAADGVQSEVRSDSCPDIGKVLAFNHQAACGMC